MEAYVPKKAEFRLKAELEKTGKRYDNYMAQMQTLIKQKAIEASGAKKPWWKIW